MKRITTLGSVLLIGLLAAKVQAAPGPSANQPAGSTGSPVLPKATVQTAQLPIIAPMPQSTVQLYYDLEEVVAAGAVLYRSQCAACHGLQLEGAPKWHVRDAAGYLPAPPHDETGHTWHHSDQLLFELTKYGPKIAAGEDYKTNMPAFEGVLTDKEIIAILSYIKSTWPDEIIKIHNEQINQR